MDFQKAEKSKQCHILALLLFGWRSHEGINGDLTFNIVSSKHFLKNLDWHVIEICRKVSQAETVFDILVLIPN